ncbi:hypothetical protein V2K79_12315 [Pseudomonas alliivorans]|nr:hypothetical protein [Pseudomonas alliivorans]MEE4752839.1 hypothetical protein [Pseudomonas alliivorans]
MTVDIEKLKAAALAATKGEWRSSPGNEWDYPIVYVDLPAGGPKAISTLFEADWATDEDADFVGLANPAVVLEMIAELKSLRIGNADLRTANKSLRGSCEAVGKEFKQAKRERNAATRERDQLKAELAGLKTGYEAYERVNAELRAEFERLRKDSARYQWLREPEAGNIEVVEWIGPHAASLVGDDLDSVVDAAMSKEASHD